MNSDEIFIHFLNEANESLVDPIKMVPMPLFKGMRISIHGHGADYEVIDWNFHLGHGDELPGLRIVLRQK